MANETGWTPGPWHWECGPEPLEQQYAIPEARRAILGADSHGHPFAMVYEEAYHRGDLDANAALIAAAPALAEALQDMVDQVAYLREHLSPKWRSFTEPTTTRAVGAAVAALALAEPKP